MSITRNQWIAIVILALGLISGATGQMTDIFGAGIAKSVASSASFLSSFVAGVQIILGSQGQQVKSVEWIATGPKSEMAEAAQQALISGTNTIAQDKSIPTSLEAKAALIDAAASQAEVVGKINVTSAALVNATQSNQVQKAA